MASPGLADNTNQLTISDLAEVLQLLRRHGYSGTSYYTLGLYLGLSVNTIRIIEADHRGDTGRCLSECLTKWLEKADNVQKKGGPTIYSLVSALRELGENGVAEGIDMEMHSACRILARYTSSQSLVIELVLLYHSENLIKEMMLPTKMSGDALLIQIKEAVCNDHHKLEVFAVILCKVKAAAGIGRAINKEYREAFLIANGENAEELKIFIRQSMIAEFKTMRLKFGATFSSVKDAMTAKPPALEKIRDTLIFSYPALKPQLAQCQDIHSILELISENCSLNDISMLEFFVTRSEIDELVEIIKEYNEAIKKFSETKLTEYLEEELSYASPLQCEKITIVVDRKTDDCTLDDVRRLSADTFHDLSRNIRLNVIRDDNSFVIICSFPLILSEQLITAALNNIDVLKENKVKRLTIGYCTVYEVKDTSTPTTTEIDEYTSSLSTSSGLMKQLMLSLSVQLINSKEEGNALNEKNKAIKKEAELMKKEAESLKETLDTKNKTLSNSFAESERLRKLAAETKQLLEEKVSHLTESEEENEKLKEENKLLAEQLTLFQFEKEKIKQSESRSIEKHDKGSHQEENEDIQSKEAETEMLQSTQNTIQSRMAFEIESLKGELKQKDDEINEVRAESKKEIELLQEKITTMGLQLIEKEKQVQGTPKDKDSFGEVFEDDNFGDIIIDHPLILKIIETKQFKRLTDIKKLGYTYHTLKATYSRHQHGIGMYYLAGEYIKQIQKNQPELNITDSDVLCVQIAALCFNLGHGPFSHIFEMFLDEFDKPWRNVSEASVLMFEYILEDNEDIRATFEEYLDLKDVTFIKELIQGVGEQRKNKRFLYEIVVSKRSGLDVSMIDSTMRDAAVLGKNVTFFKWREFFNKVRVLRCDDDELHICVQKDALETCNDLFRIGQSSYRELYCLRKNRAVATMLKRILVRSNKTPLIEDKNGRQVTLSEATKSMFAYTQLNDSILSVIKSKVDDPEVQLLLKCLDTMKLTAQIGHVTSTAKWDENKIKKHIVKGIESCDIEDSLIIDPIKNGYEDYESLTQYYYTSDGKTGQWTNEWAQPKSYFNEGLHLRIFLVSGDRNLMKEVQQVFKKLIKAEHLEGKLYPDEDNLDLMSPLTTTGASILAQD